MSIKIQGLKKFDSIFGRLACSIAKAIVRPGKRPFIVGAAPTGNALKILVIRPGGIGDAVLLYPALKALREGFKNAEIHVLAEKRNAGILRNCPYIDRLFLYDLLPPVELFRTLRTDYDMVIDTEQWHRSSAAVSYMTKAPIRVGFGTNERAELFTHPVSYSQDDYEVHSFLNLVSAVTRSIYSFDVNEPFIVIAPNLASDFHSTLIEFRKRFRAVVGMFSGATIRERRWGASRFAELSKKLSDEGIGTVIVGGSDDIKDAAEFEGMARENDLMNFVGKTSLMETTAIISGLDLFVTGDTGLMHVAYGVGTPTVSLFGAGIQKKWAPIGKHHVVLNKNLPCSPCTKFGYTPRCPYDVKCLSDITVEEVKESVLRLLSELERF